MGPALPGRQRDVDGLLDQDTLVALLFQDLLPGRERPVDLTHRGACGCDPLTGDGAGNTTLSYFGPSDGDSNPSALPEGGYGRLNIRYNPTRALPDGMRRIGHLSVVDGGKS